MTLSLRRSLVPAYNLRVRHGHRPDIDGLRAFAIIAVLGFHAGIPGFAGGFVGVDVFFVISGYVIAGILSTSLRGGGFSFRDFYSRRINRLFPALAIVLASCGLIGWSILYFHEFAALSRDIARSSFYVSNFGFLAQGGYFDSRQTTPLLHLWSLAVEEQFYIAFPLFAVVCWKKGWSLSRIAAVGIIGSFVAALVSNRVGRGSEAFYMVYTRLWEILVGVWLLALSIRAPRVRHVSVSTRANLLAITGFIVLAGSVALLNGSMPWPGFLALLPVAGTAAIIAAGADAALNRLILSNPIVVSIGLLSYPLYLWHWPLLVFGHLVNDGQPPVLARMAIVCSSAVLALITYHLVEWPVRFEHNTRRTATALAALLLAIGLSAYGLAELGTSPRLSLGEKHALADIGPEWAAPNGGPTADGRGFILQSLKGDSTSRVVMIGDSHMQHYWPRLLALASETGDTGPEIAMAGFSGCPPLPGVNRPGISWTGVAWNCPQFYAAAMSLAAKPATKKVVLSGFWEEYFNRRLLVSAKTEGPDRLSLEDDRTSEMFAQLERDIRSLTSAGKSVFIILSNPRPVRRARGAEFPRLGRAAPRSFRKNDFLAEALPVNDRLRATALRAGATVIDPVAHMCPQSTCSMYTEDGIPIYRDDHLRPHFVRNYVAYLDRVLDSNKGKD